MQMWRRRRGSVMRTGWNHAKERTGKRDACGAAVRDGRRGAAACENGAMRREEKREKNRNAPRCELGVKKNQTNKQENSKDAAAVN